MVVLGYDATDPGRHGRDADDGRSGSPGPANAAPDRRHAVRLLRALQRARDRERPALRARGRLSTRSSSSAAALRSSAPERSSRSGIPVMGHVGLTPQSASALGGFKAQGKTGESAAKIADDALALQAAGCFAIVFEAVPAAVTEALMPRIEVPVIGIGAGTCDRRPGARVPRPARDHDGSHVPKFVKRYAEIHDAMVAGVRAYAEEVRVPAIPRCGSRVLGRSRRGRGAAGLPGPGQPRHVALGLVGGQ